MQHMPFFVRYPAFANADGAPGDVRSAKVAMRSPARSVNIVAVWCGPQGTVRGPHRSRRRLGGENSMSGLMRRSHAAKREATMLGDSVPFSIPAFFGISVRRDDCEWTLIANSECLHEYRRTSDVPLRRSGAKRGTAPCGVADLRAAGFSESRTAARSRDGPSGDVSFVSRPGENDESASVLPLVRTEDQQATPPSRPNDFVPPLDPHPVQIHVPAGRQIVDRQVDPREPDRLAGRSRNHGLGQRHRGPFQLELEGIPRRRPRLPLDLPAPPLRTELRGAARRPHHRRNQNRPPKTMQSHTIISQIVQNFLLLDRANTGSDESLRR
jgi:hypothetical protein